MPMILLALSILPALILLWIFERQDKGRKEPRRLKWRIFWWGIMATIFAIAIEMPMDWLVLKVVDPIKDFWLYIFIVSFIIAALVEEALKLWVVKTHVFRSGHFDEVMDGITYAIIASLGFATFENIFYVLEGGIAIGILRALISVPAHALFSGIMGFYIGKAKFAAEEGKGNRLIYKGLLFAILYHGLFDFFLFSESILVFLVLPLMAVMIIHLKKLIGHARFADKVIGQLEPKKPRSIKSFAGFLPQF